VPLGGPISAQILSVVRFAKDGMSYPLLASTIFCAASGVERWRNKLLAADLFLQNDLMPQKKGKNGPKRPLGPAGIP